MSRLLLQHGSYLTTQNHVSFATYAKLKSHEHDDAASSLTKDHLGKQPKPRNKTVAEQDEELMAKLTAMSDDGGAAGVEFEDGKPVAMKKAVRSNMFRIMPVFKGR